MEKKVGEQVGRKKVEYMTVILFIQYCVYKDNNCTFFPGSTKINLLFGFAAMYFRVVQWLFKVFINHREVYRYIL